MKSLPSLSVGIPISLLNKVGIRQNFGNGEKLSRFEADANLAKSTQAAGNLAQNGRQESSIKRRLEKLALPQSSHEKVDAKQSGPAHLPSVFWNPLLNINRQDSTLRTYGVGNRNGEETWPASGV